MNLDNSYTFIFRQFDLPFTNIDNCVCPYNSGIYGTEGSRIDNGAFNQIGPSNAFQKNLSSFLTKVTGKQKTKDASVARVVHLVPHKYSEIMHHIHRKKEMAQFPIRFFVSITHSGHSISPHNDVWSKFSGKEKLMMDEGSAAYELMTTVCLFPSRLERIEDLELHPFLACCNTKRSKERQKGSRKYRLVIRLRPNGANPIVNSINDNKHDMRAGNSQAAGEEEKRDELTKENQQERGTKRYTARIAGGGNGEHQKRIIPVKERMDEGIQAIAEDPKGEICRQPVEPAQKIQIEMKEFVRRAELEYNPLDSVIIIKDLPLPNCDGQQIIPTSKLKAKIFVKTSEATNELFEGGEKDNKTAKNVKSHDNKEKKTKIGVAGTIAISSTSSSSSSSSDEEKEEIHILVQERPGIELRETETIFQTKPSTKSPSTEHPQNTTKTETWHEETIGPEKVTTEVDEHGNIIKRIVKTEHIRHTVQTQSMQAIPTDNGTNGNIAVTTPAESPVLHSVVYENGLNRTEFDSFPGELVASKVVTTGNRTVETFTYKKEKDGMVETRVEHRITIHSNDEIDHDSELNRAIMEATNMNPELKVEKVEVERRGGGSGKK